MVPLILASASERRLQLLRQIGIDVTAVPADVDERQRPAEKAETLVTRLAEAKVSALVGHPQCTAARVLGADTVVVVDETILGKPRDRHDAVGMILTLQGREHRVITGVCLREAKGDPVTLTCETRVRFRSIDKAEAEQYWATGEPCGKAGAYAIQGRAARFVEYLSGSYSNVVGLPLFETAWLLDGRHRTGDE